MNITPLKKLLYIYIFIDTHPHILSVTLEDYTIIQNVNSGYGIGIMVLAFDLSVF